MSWDNLEIGGVFPQYQVKYNANNRLLAPMYQPVMTGTKDADNNLEWVFLPTAGNGGRRSNFLAMIDNANELLITVVNNSADEFAYIFSRDVKIINDSGGDLIVSTYLQKGDVSDITDLGTPLTKYDFDNATTMSGYTGSVFATDNFAHTNNFYISKRDFEYSRDIDFLFIPPQKYYAIKHVFSTDKVKASIAVKTQQIVKETTI